MNIRYPAVIKPQKPSGYFVRFPDIEEAITQGETIDECLVNAAEVLSLVLDHRIAEGLPISEAFPHQECTDDRSGCKTAAAILAAQPCGALRPLSELARALETSWPSAQRLERIRNTGQPCASWKKRIASGKRLVRLCGIDHTTHYTSCDDRSRTVNHASHPAHKDVFLRAETGRK